MSSFLHTLFHAPTEEVNLLEEFRTFAEDEFLLAFDFDRADGSDGWYYDREGSSIPMSEDEVYDMVGDAFRRYLRVPKGTSEDQELREFVRSVLRVY